MKKQFIIAIAFVALSACSKTPGGQGTDTPDTGFMSITVQEASDVSATVLYIPKDDSELYAYGITLKSDFDGGFIPSDVDVDDQSICRRSAYAHTFEWLDAETTYVVYAYGVDESGKYVEGRIESAEFTTLARQKEPTFGISVDNVTPGKADIHIDTKEFTGTYFYGYMPKGQYDACGSDAEVFDKVIDRIMSLNAHLIESGWSESEIIRDMLRSGDADMSVSYLRPDEDYVFCVFGCNASPALTTEDVSAATFHTPVQDMAEDVTFTIEDIDVTTTAPTLACVSYTLKANDGYEELFFAYSIDKYTYDQISRIYTGEVLPIDEFCWYDYFDIMNYNLTYYDLDQFIENFFHSGEISLKEDKGRLENDSILYVYAIAVDGKYGMPRQSKASVHEIIIPGWANDKR